MKISNFFLDFFNKFMLSECSLAISCYFYAPQYPRKIATAIPLNQVYVFRRAEMHAQKSQTNLIKIVFDLNFEGEL
jgi:hypothetical protein